MSDRTRIQGDPLAIPAADIAIDGILDAPEIAPPETFALPPTAEARAGAIAAFEIQAREARASAGRPADPHGESALQRAAEAEERLRTLVLPPSDPDLSAAEQAAEALAREGGRPDGTGGGRGGAGARTTDGATTLALASSFMASLADDITYTTYELTEGNDTHVVTDSENLRVLAKGGNDRVSIGAGATGFYILDGGAGADSLVGAGGDDIFVGGPGADTIRGGAGRDMADYATSGAGMTITLSTSTYSTAMTKPNGGDATGDQLNGIEDVRGTAFNDLLGGNQLDNTLIAGLGNDTVKGGAGNDALYGDGTDTGLAEGGADLLDGGAGNDTLHGGAGDDSLIAGFGDDALHGGAGADLLSAGDGHDWLDGGEGADQLLGNLGNDTLHGGAGNDELYASSGNDEIHGGDGHDAINGGEGNDSIAGDAGNDAIVASSGADTLDGGAGDDTLEAGDQDDLLLGGDGADTLNGGTGADTIDGGGGVDVVDYAAAGSAVGVDLTAGTGFWAADGDVLARVEDVMGSQFGDLLIGDAFDNVLTGRGGADTLIGQGGTDTADYSGSAAAVTVQFNATLADPTLAGSGGGGDAEGDVLQVIERVIGSAFDDTFIGGELADIFAGGLGADALDGGGGNDTADYSFSPAAMMVDLLAGAASDGDTLANMENVIGSAFDDSIHGNDAANRLEGGAGDDWLRGGTGPDTLMGGAGIDTADYSSSAGGVLIQLVDNPDPNLTTGGATNAGSATSDAAGDRLSQVENILGSAFTDDLRGSAIGNKLASGAGNDILRGGSGADLLVVNGTNGSGGFKQLIGEGIGDGGAAGWDTYRIIGGGATAGANLTLISGYQLGENIELNSFNGSGTANLTLGATTYRTVVFQGLTAGVAHDTRILVGVMTADPVQQQALINQANAWRSVILASSGPNDLDGDGSDLILNSNLSANDPWG